MYCILQIKAQNVDANCFQFRSKTANAFVHTLKRTKEDDETVFCVFQH